MISNETANPSTAVLDETLTLSPELKRILGLNLANRLESDKKFDRWDITTLGMLDT